MSAEFFNPTGTLSGWEVQSTNETESKQTAVALDRSGDKLAVQQYHDAKTRTETYVATSATAAIPKLGATVNGLKVESLSVAYSATAFAILTLNLSDSPISRTYTGSLQTVGSVFGVPNTLCGANIEGARSATYNLSASKAEELGGQGSVIGAEIYDGVETLTVDGATITTPPTGWLVDSKTDSKSNTAMEAEGFTITKHITKDTAPSS